MKMRIGIFNVDSNKKVRLPRKLKKKLRTDAVFAITTAIGCVNDAVQHSLKITQMPPLPKSFSRGAIYDNEGNAYGLDSREFIIASKELATVGISCAEAGTRLYKAMEELQKG